MKLSVEEVRKFVSFFSRIGVVSLESRWTDAALLLKQRYGTQFFDSLLLSAAEENGSISRTIPFYNLDILIDNWATVETLDLFAKKRKGTIKCCQCENVASDQFQFPMKEAA